MNDSVSVLSQIAIFLVAGILFIALALFVSKLLRPNRPNPQKLSSYESGETPQGPAWIQFNLRFYVLALVFILFEVEVVFLFPWSVVLADGDLNQQTQNTWGWFAFVEMLIFIIILVLGLAYAWRKGHLDWIKSKSQINDVPSPVPSEMYKAINKKFLSPKATSNQ